jgi:methionyl-tRNA synthetase
VTKESSNKKIVVTAALPYSNGTLHVGHIAGAYLPADIYVRYLRLRGKDVFAICGSDDHGVAIMLKAQQEGKTPQETAKFYHDKHEKNLKSLGINFDIFGATSQNKLHAELSQKFFLTLFEKGYFEKKETPQFYDSETKMFLPDRYVTGTCGFCGKTDQNSDQCENCGKILDTESLKNPVSKFSGKPASISKTKHWFIDLARFKNDVSAWLQTAAVRDTTLNYVEGLLESGLVQRSMTRDLTWGIPVPLEDPDAKGKVLYVWFDAPIGYISYTVQLLKEKNLSQDIENPWLSKDTKLVHFIGEDNTIFHCIIWIAMLAAEGNYVKPSAVVVNKFLNIKFPDKEMEKISKSKGNAVYIEDYINDGGNVDALRYYLAANAPENDRTVYKPDDLIARYNGELGNNVGNLLNRLITVSRKYFGEELPKYFPEKKTDEDEILINAINSTKTLVENSFENYKFKDALNAVMAFSRDCNKYLDSKAPWKTAKTDLEAASNSLRVAMRAIKAILYMLNPYIPEASFKGLKMLGIDKPLNWDDLSRDFSEFTGYGHQEVLFPRMEADENLSGTP